MEITFEGGKVVTAHIHGHDIRTDQPVSNGGTNSSPAPFDLYLASIGTCSGVYVKSFCDRRNIPAEGIKIIQTAEWNRETGLPSTIRLDIRLPSGFPEKYKSSVIHAAGLCLVKKSIASPPGFEITASTPDEGTSEL
ncbi:MAG TPA: OsmC family protein [Bacteroidales bacterium]|jgi:ribosomal protein S12 methylthiotransferase accessory factor|nr:OsmC family protein [Bacteroidales bacterium]HQJ82445.1 OsmC family protein [Bacteroidales bacterium]